MYYDNDWALIVPMANEEKEFQVFIEALQKILDRLASGTVYLVVDTVSKDQTLTLCLSLSARDRRFRTIWAPENKSIVDAYIRGYRAAYENKHDVIIEMDAGLSHDPRAIPMFLRVLNEGNECAFGSRFINGGSMTDSPLFRRFLSRAGTILSNILLGTNLYDMTSGFQGFHADIVGKLINYPLRSRAHFYQTEVRYLLRKTRYAEIPIHYQAPSPNVSRHAICNSLWVLGYYAFMRVTGRAKNIARGTICQQNVRS
jgi:dolichol-phosphate mannosyltransferase